MLILGGVIPESDVALLKEMGVAGVFTSGVSIKTVADFIRSNLSP